MDLVGMKLDDASESVIVRPAKMFDFGVQIGTLRPGSEADISICELQHGTSNLPVTRPPTSAQGTRCWSGKAVVCRGRYFVKAA
jgi:imidazolonepropionase-like amidohydrolase